ncbi:unnamed protein product, partial [Rotaria magnacalcarata]
MCNPEIDCLNRIYRHPLIQGYSLPYEVGHAKLVHSDSLRSVLIRAVCYCSSVEDFNLERICLELTCLTNGYPLRFVETHVQHFFNFFHLHSMRYSKDRIMYNKFRHNWFNYIKMRHELSDQLQQFDDEGQLIHLNYLYEYGARCQFNEQFHRIWSEYFNQHPNLSIPKYEFSVKQENNDQQQLSSIQSYSSSNDTPTKISTLTEKEDIIHSQEVQATDDMPPFASLLSCFVRIERCQESLHDTVEVISTAQIHGEESTGVDNKKSKCHGNKKLQRFKRKWRTRGLNEEEIVTLINTKGHDISEQS